MGAFVRFVVYKLAEYWVLHGGLDQFASSQNVTPIDIKKTTLVFQRLSETPSSTRDIMETSAYWAITLDGVFSDTWDDGGYGGVEAAIVAWWEAIKGVYGTSLTFVEIRWYEAGTDVTDPNPTFRVTPVGVTGSSSVSSMPPQVSTTLTLQTASRRHWGRMFLPNPIVSEGGTGASDGRWIHSFVDLVVSSWASQQAALLLDHSILQVVWSPAAQSILGITAYSSDDVPDTQRRRRFATVGYRAIAD